LKLALFSLPADACVPFLYRWVQVGPLSLEISFPTLPHDVAPHTLALPLSSGTVFGPFSTHKDNLGVPQILDSSDQAWFYRSVEDEPDPLIGLDHMASARLDFDPESYGLDIDSSYNRGDVGFASSGLDLDPAWYSRLAPVEISSLFGPKATSHTVNVDVCATPLVKRPTTTKTKIKAIGKLQLISHLSSGRLWDTFRAIVHSPHPYSTSETPSTDTNSESDPDLDQRFTSTSVIVKTTCPLIFPSESFSHPHTSHPTKQPAAESRHEHEHYTSMQARRAILQEDRIYRSLAASSPSLGGKGIPRYHGLWAGVLPLPSTRRWNRKGLTASREVWVMVLENCGDGVELDELSWVDK